MAERIHWVKNSGQFPSGVAWVANWPSPLDSQYKGSGEISIDHPLAPTQISYEASDGLVAHASTYQIVVLHGTALAAALNVLNPEP